MTVFFSSYLNRLQFELRRTVPLSAPFIVTGSRAKYLSHVLSQGE